MAAWLILDFSHAKFDDSLDLQAKARYTEAAAKAGEAAAAASSSPAYQIHAGVSQALLYINGDEAERGRSPNALSQSIAFIRRGIREDPRGALGYANLAQALRLAEDTPGATEAARRAFSLAPHDGTIAALAGTVFEWAGLIQEAAAAYANAVRLDPDLSQSVFWSSTPERRDMRDTAIESSGLTACQVGRAAVIYGNYEDDLEALARDCQSRVTNSPASTSDRTALALLLHAFGRSSQATKEAETAVRDAPDDAAARTTLAIILSSQGDIERVRHQFLSATYLDSPEAVLLLALTYEPLGADHPLTRNLGLLARQEPLPIPVLKRLKPTTLLADESKPGNWIFRHQLGAKYYLAELLREAPTVLLIPGEWLEFRSPRTSLALELLMRE